MDLKLVIKSYKHLRGAIQYGISGLKSCKKTGHSLQYLVAAHVCVINKKHPCSASCGPESHHSLLCYLASVHARQFGVFKHQLINQPFCCTEMEYVSINPTDLRDCFPAAWTCERYVSHPIYSSLFFSALCLLFFLILSFFFKV